MALQPFPPPDHKRLARIVKDVADLLHEPCELSDEGALSVIASSAQAKIERWIGHVLEDAASRRKWWFLENVATTTLAAGQDVIDLTGHVDKVSRAYAPRRLWPMSLAELTDVRMGAAAVSAPNAARTLTHYALEAGRRVHVWPAPSATVTFAVLYTRPMHVALLPSAFWEAIVLDGVLGQYGRHFDRDALTQDPEFFELRYEKRLSRATTQAWDIERALRWDAELEALTTVTASSATDAATAKLVPASLSGVGHVTIQTGDYPLTVAA